MASLLVVLLIGNYYEMKSVMGASRSLELLVEMMPSTAHRIRDGKTEEIPVSDIEVDDLVLVRPGEKVPVDGVVTEGESYLDESMLTGESKPVKREKDHKVIGGSINGNGSLTIRVASTGKDSYLNKVIQLEIGRASCRERREIAVEDERLKAKNATEVPEYTTQHLKSE